MATHDERLPSPPDWTGAVAWAVAAGARAEDVVGAWRLDRAAVVPVGGLWDVVRVARAAGFDALDRLWRRGEAVGPVLDARPRDAVEYIVPRGDADGWPALPCTVAVGAGVIRCPSPRLTRAHGRRALCGRRWLVPPPVTVSGPATTDSDVLCECVAAALVRRALSR
ncbi:hypothetical protein ACTWP5_01420 [Streptomyces sp. 4N509B]|uniref:hypothetical protein n=1 Tax=Streptomyces sp. 4N509B TaxID=3457413 RepID=UPI003FD6057C